jgi:hypothetical protein
LAAKTLQIRFAKCRVPAFGGIGVELAKPCARITLYHSEAPRPQAGVIRGTGRRGKHVGHFAFTRRRLS